MSMSGSTDPFPTLKTATEAIADVKKTISKNKRFLFLRFKDPQWISYFLEELFFRLFTSSGEALPLKSFANVPTNAFPNGILIEIPAEMGLDLATIGIFTAPPLGTDLLGEYKLPITRAKKRPSQAPKTKAG